MKRRPVAHRVASFLPSHLRPTRSAKREGNDPTSHSLFCRPRPLGEQTPPPRTSLPHYIRLRPIARPLGSVKIGAQGPAVLVSGSVREGTDREMRGHQTLPLSETGR